MSNVNMIPVYFLIAELTAWLMGTRILSLLRTGASLHPIEMFFLVVGLWKFRSQYRWSFPYKSFPVVFLFISLVCQVPWRFPPTTLFSVFSSGFMVPLYEELLYRIIIADLVQRRLSKILFKRQIFWANVLISSFTFTFAHRSTVTNYSDMLVCMVSGVALSSTYLISGKNLIEPLAIHMLHNLHALLIDMPQGSVFVPLFFYSVIFLANTVRIDVEQYG